MERVAGSTCEYCETEDDELYRLPMLLQVGDRVLWVVCRLCYTYLAGAEPQPRFRLLLRKAEQ
jgi:hypothetical protein